MNERAYFLDSLRIAAFVLLVPFHVGMYYVSWGWHVKSAQPVPALEPFMQVLNPWRLSLLFFVAGAASHFLLRRGDYVRQRSWRLLVPLLCGMLVVVPPQAYFEMVTQMGYTGSYGDFMFRYVTTWHRVCADGHCLDLPTWNHLWFVAYLWVYSLLAWLAWRCWPGLPARFANWMKQGRGPGRLLFVLALPLVAARPLVDHFPSTNNLAWDWYNHARYLWIFLLGLLAARSALWDQARRWRWLALGLYALGWSALVACHRAGQGGGPQPAGLDELAHALAGADPWWAIVAACGFARRWLDADLPGRRWLSHAIFCVYILHQTLIIVLAQALAPLRLAPVLEGPLLTALTFTGSLGGYLLAREVPGLRLCLGIASRRPAPAARSADLQRVGAAGREITAPP